MNKSRKLTALILITLFLSVFCTAAHAQADDDDEPKGMYVEEPRTFYAGLLVGTNFAQVDGDNYAGYRKIGLNVGGIGYLQLKKHLALSWEILYSQKGAKGDFIRASTIDSTLFYNYRIYANYAEIPLMINYFDQRKSHFGLGASFSRLVSGTETATAVLGQAPDFNKYPFQKNNFDILAGAQLHLWKGLFLNVRFQYSLIPIRTQPPPGFYRTQRQYNNMWTVRLMYLFI